MTVATPKKQPAFLNMHQYGEVGTSEGWYVSLWVNRTLLPGISTALQKHQHPSLQDFSKACSEVYRDEKEKYRNEHCVIKKLTTTALATSGDDSEEIVGAMLDFREDIFDAVSKAFMHNENRAIGKIGLLIRNKRR